MFDWASTLLSFLPWVGGAGMAGYAALAFFFPSFLPVIAEYLKALSPLVRGTSEGIVEYVKALWDGFLDMADNAKSVVFMLSVATISAVGGYQFATHKHNALMTELRRDYAFVKRKVPAQAPAAPKSPAFVNPFDFLTRLF